jgi:hypothetical protein
MKTIQTKKIGWRINPWVPLNLNYLRNFNRGEEEKVTGTVTGKR